MADAESNIIINVDTSIGISEIKNLQRQISELNAQLLKSGAQQAKAAQNIQRNLISNINATGKFAANVRTISSTAESFTTALEGNKLSMGQYFKYAGGATKTFGRLFKTEFNTIEKVATERVKTLQTQYIKLGRDANGALKAIAVRPLSLDMQNLSTQTAMAAQKQQLFNQLLKQGSTNLLNFGKNTQWAGRQLMVGFTIPLSIMGSMAVKEFEKIEKQAIRFKRVYGDAFSSNAETDKALEDMRNMAREFTKYGVAVEKTLELAADAAQMGLSGASLSAQVAQATRLAVLGEVDQQEALKTSVSVMNAFGIAAEDLASKIDFLNAVENETMTAISDLTIAIPKAAPVVKQLGGSIEDLAFFLTAMKEGGINASEGANALKSGLASMINPAQKTKDMLNGLGISIDSIVEGNAGDIKGTVIGMANALDQLDPLNRARAIEQLFGKFQFSRISTLFQNVIKEGSQAQRVLELTRSSSEELAIISERELGKVEDSPLFKFQKAVEGLQDALAPIGKEFLKAITPVIEFGKTLLERFNSMGDGAKSFAIVATTVVAGIGPILLMTFGLVANGIANLIKMFAAISSGMRGAGSSSNDLALSTEYMTQQQLEAAAVAASLDQTHSKLIQTFSAEAAAVDRLATSYGRAIVAQSSLLNINPETGLPTPLAAKGGRRGPRPKKYNKGIVSVPGPKGAGDIVPAMLSPGEAVIPARQSQKYAGLISGMVNDDIPGYRFGLNPFAAMLRSSRVTTRMKSQTLKNMLGKKDTQYRSAFETGTGDDYIDRISGRPKISQQFMRTDMEQATMGIPRNAPASSRPTYGSVELTPMGRLLSRMFGLPGKQFRNIAKPGNKHLDIYGDTELVGKRSMSKRSSMFAGDLLRSFSNSKGFYLSRRNQMGPEGSMLPPMRGASKEQLQKQFSAFKHPFGKNILNSVKPDGSKSYTANPGYPYVEAQVAGGFDLKEISKIRVPSRAEARQLQKLIDQAGLKIRVTPQNAPAVVKMLSNMFGTRFEKGYLPSGSQSGRQRYPQTVAGRRARALADLRGGSSKWLGAGFGKVPIPSQTPEDAVAIKAYEKSLGRKATPNELKNLLGSDLVHKRPSTRLEIFNGERVQVKNWDPENLRRDHRLINQFLNDVSGGKKTFLNSIDVKQLAAKSGVSEKVAQQELQKLKMGIHPAATSNAYKVLSGVASFKTSARARATESLLKFRMSDTSANSYMKLASKGLFDFKPDPEISAKAAARQNATLRKYEKEIKALSSSSSSTSSIGKKPTVKKPTAKKPAVKTPAPTQARSFSLSKILGRGMGVAGVAGMLASTFGGMFQDRQYNSGVVSVPGPKGKGDVVPAMLTPGEAVIPAGMSKKYAPLISGMINDNIPGYNEGLGPYQDSSGRWRSASGKFIKAPEQSQPRTSRMSGMGGKVAGVASMAGMGAMAYGMSGGPGAAIASAAALPLMFAPMLAPLLGMLKNPIVLAVAAIGGLAVAAFALAEAHKKQIKESYDLAMATGASSQALKGLSEFGGNVTAGEIMDRRRSEKDVFQIAAGKTGFGQNFLQSEDGSAFAENIGKVISEKGRAAALDTITNQMSMAIASGALTPSQARDVVAALGQEMQDYDLSIKINSQLLSLFGPNGENLLSDPLTISMQLSEKSVSGMSFENLFPGLENIGEFGTRSIFGGELLPYNAEEDLTWLDKTLGSIGLSDAMQDSPFTFWTIQDQVKLTGDQIGYFNAQSAIALQTQQELVDSLDLTYEKRIKNAKAQGDLAEVTRLEAEYSKSRNTLAEQNAKVVEQIKQTFSIIPNQDEVLSAMNTQIKDLFADDKLVSGMLPEFLKTLDGLDDETEVVLKTSLLSGDLSPIALQNLLADEDHEAIVRIITTLGGAAAGQASDLANMFGDQTVDIFANADDARSGKKTPVAARGQVLSSIGNMGAGQALDFMSGFDPVIQALSSAPGDGLAVGLKFFYENPEALKSVNEDLDAFAEKAGDGEITTTIIQQVFGQEMFDKVVANQEYFDKLDKNNKVVYTTVLRILGEMDPTAREAVAINAAMSGKGADKFKEMSGGLSFAEVEKSHIIPEAGRARALKLADLAYQSSMAEDVTNVLGSAGSTTGNTETTTGQKKDPFLNILSRLKEVRDAAVDASGGIETLRAALAKGASAANEFVGIEQKLLFAGYGQEFIGSVRGMNEETRKEFVTIENGVVKVTEAGKLMNKAFSEVTLGDFQFSIASGVAAVNTQTRAMTKLVDAGMSVADAYEVVQNEALAYAIATSTGTKKVEDLVGWLERLRKKQEELKLSTPEGIQSWLQDYQGALSSATSKVSEFFAAQRAVADEDFFSGTNISGRNVKLFNMDAIMKQIDESNEKLETFRYNLGNLEYDLSSITSQEDLINKKYDERLKALDKVLDANSDIADQQKSQLDVVSALSSGDIAAAARAVQENRAREADRQAENRKAAIERQRESELQGLRSSSGKTRKQLEDEILDLTNKINKEQAEGLVPSERRLSLAQRARDVALEAIGEEGYLGKTEKAWGAVENAARLAVVQSEAFRTSLINILKSIPGISFDADGNVTLDSKAFEAGIKTGTGGTQPTPTKTSVFQAEGVTVLDRDKAAKAAIGAVKSGTATDPLAFANQVKSQVLANRALVNNPATSAADKARLTQENIKLMTTTGLKFNLGGLVPDYKRMGGLIPYKRMGGLIPYKANGGLFQSINTDTVPAMLTPGEFVIRRHSVQKYGTDKLSSINNGTYNGESVYNYSVNVNVKSDSNPDQIAQAVMTQIRQVDSMRLRGNKF